MPNPLIRYNDVTAALPPQYCGSCSYYSVLASYSRVIIHDGMRFDKRFKSTHRTSIADTRGILDLTVPVAKPQHSTSASWSEATVSPHGGWWNIHLTALESAYGRTPFFEFYIDDFLPLFKENACGTSITDFDGALDAIIRRLLGLSTEVEHLTAPELPGGVKDLRKANFSTLAPVAPYYQVRADRLGFIPDLSILDLLFNLGPEAPLHLLRK
ncbi:MAG: WbqC family protein [Paramuribaculum sp.]|nr:WbqC family protein [Paramuribaculum sp.]